MEAHSLFKKGKRFFFEKKKQKTFAFCWFWQQPTTNQNKSEFSQICGRERSPTPDDVSAYPPTRLSSCRRKPASTFPTYRKYKWDESAFLTLIQTN
jgi:hypothetical protein